MTALPFLILFAATPDGIDLPTQTHGGVTAAMTVEVADAPAGPGRARASYELTLAAAVPAETGPLRLDDAVAGWRAAVVGSAEASCKSGWRRTWRVVLEQLKPGVVPLPGMSVRLADGHEFSWPELLHEAIDVIPPVYAEPPTPAGAGWAAFAAMAVASALAAALVIARLRRRTAAVPPTSFALLAITLAADVPAADRGRALADAVRRYLSAPTRTTAEIESEFGPAWGGVLRRCDEARFGGRQISDEEWNALTATAAQTAEAGMPAGSG